AQILPFELPHRVLIADAAGVHLRHQAIQFSSHFHLLLELLNQCNRRIGKREKMFANNWPPQCEVKIASSKQSSDPRLQSVTIRRDSDATNSAIPLPLCGYLRAPARQA